MTEAEAEALAGISGSTGHGSSMAGAEVARRAGRQRIGTNFRRLE